MELFFITAIEQELQELYTLLDRNNDDLQKQNIQQAIQARNLQLSRLMPCE